MASPHPCEACKKPIQFIEGPNGKLIPAQRIKTVYMLVERQDEFGHPVIGLQKVEIGDQLYVSHFETCTDPARFSRRNR